jgi:hypothetical protein
MPDRISTGSDLGVAKLLEHVIAVHVRQVQVEQDDVVIIELAEIEASSPRSVV